MSQEVLRFKPMSTATVERKAQFINFNDHGTNVMATRLPKFTEK